MERSRTHTQAPFLQTLEPWAMRVCDTHEDVRMCVDKLCNRKMCVRQVSVCTPPVVHTVVATTCVRNPKKTLSRKKNNERKNEHLSLHDHLDKKKIFNSSSGFGKCMYRTPFKKNSQTSSFHVRLDPSCWYLFHQLALHQSLWVGGLLGFPRHMLTNVGILVTTTYFVVLLLVLSRRKLSCEQFSSFFSLTSCTTHSSSIDWYIVMAKTLSAKIRFSVADQ